MPQPSLNCCSFSYYTNIVKDSTTVDKKELPSAIVTLGIFLHMCLSSYQTCLLKITYDQFGLTDLSAIFDYPVAEADDPLKMVTYCSKHSNLGDKRLQALPYLLQLCAIYRRMYKLFHPTCAQHGHSLPFPPHFI